MPFTVTIFWRCSPLLLPTQTVKVVYLKFHTFFFHKNTDRNFAKFYEYSLISNVRFTQSVTKNNFCSDLKVSVEGFSSFAYNVLASRF